MDKKKQRFSIGYFVVVLLMLFLLQYYFAAPGSKAFRTANLKNLSKENSSPTWVVTDEVVRGKIKAEGVREVLSDKQMKRAAMMNSKRARSPCHL